LIASFIHSSFVGDGGGGEERLSTVSSASARATIVDHTVRAQM
jgi:hypothetical protein